MRSRRIVRCPGWTGLAEVEPWDTAASLAQKALRQKCASLSFPKSLSARGLAGRGVKGGRGWTLGLETREADILIGGRDYVLDLLAYLELPKEFPAQRPLFLIAPSQRVLEKAYRAHQLKSHQLPFRLPALTKEVWTGAGTIPWTGRGSGF